MSWSIAWVSLCLWVSNSDDDDDDDDADRNDDDDSDRSCYTVDV